MPRSPYAGRHGELVEQICESLAAGAALVEVCERPGMPSKPTVMRWTRADPALKARLQAARRRIWRRDPSGREGAIRWLLERLEGGWTLHRACREPQAPNYHTVQRWMRADPTLRQRLRQAQAWGVQFRPRWRQERYVYDYGRVDRFLERVGRGEAVAAMRAAHQAPDRAIVRAWKHMRSDFVERYEAAKRAGAAVRRARPRRPFDPDVADAIVVRVNRGETLAALTREKDMPGPTALRRWQREQPDFAAALRLAVKGGQRNRARPRAGPSPAQTRRIGRAIAAGATISALCARSDMPNIATLHAWRRTHPAFAAKVATAIAFRDWMAADGKAAGLYEQALEFEAQALRGAPAVGGGGV